MILVDVDLPLVNNLQIVPEQKEKPNSNTEIDNEPEVSGGVQYYILVCDREHHSTKPPERYEYEDLIAYALLTSFGDPSTFWEAISNQEKDKWMVEMMDEMKSLNKNKT